MQGKLVKNDHLWTREMYAYSSRYLGDIKKVDMFYRKLNSAIKRGISTSRTSYSSRNKTSNLANKGETQVQKQILLPVAENAFLLIFNIFE